MVYPVLGYCMFTSMLYGFTLIGVMALLGASDAEQMFLGTNFTVGCFCLLSLAHRSRNINY